MTRRVSVALTDDQYAALQAVATAEGCGVDEALLRAYRRALGESPNERICGVVSASGPNGEPLACGYRPRHDGGHSWATQPTFPLPVDRLRERLQQ